MAPTETQQIAQLNDQFRRFNPSVPGERVMTQGVAQLLERLDLPPQMLIQQVIQFDDFTQSSDPYGERDFGVLEFHGEKLFWKIDAFDLDYHMGSDDPTDLTKTRRVLTIMLASEW